MFSAPTETYLNIFTERLFDGSGYPSSSDRRDVTGAAPVMPQLQEGLREGSLSGRCRLLPYHCHRAGGGKCRRDVARRVVRCGVRRVVERRIRIRREWRRRVPVVEPAVGRRVPVDVQIEDVAGKGNCPPT